MISTKKIKEIFHKALHEGWTANRLAASVGLGIYVAFCPFFGAHTLMVVAFAWLFRLNLPILLIAAAVNNPWTMIPIYTAGYVFGYWVIHQIFHLQSVWTFSLARIFGSGELCVWSFLIGGNILGIFFGLISFIIFYFIFKRCFPVTSRPLSPQLDSKETIDRKVNGL